MVSALEPGVSHIEICLCIPSDDQGRVARHCPPTSEDAARAGWHSHQLSHPGNHLFLYEHWSLIETSHVGINRRSQHVCQHCQRCSGSLHPTPKTWVDITVRIWQYVFEKISVSGFRTLALDGQWLAEIPYRLVRHCLPCRLIAKVW